LAHDEGVTLWDSADAYGTHSHVATALRNLERSSVAIMTKTDSRSATGIREDIPRFLRELGTDHVDVLLMHGLTARSWVPDGSSEVQALQEAREKGTVRAIGMSCHDFEALKRAATTDWIDVVMARVNYAGTRMDASPNDVIPVLKRLHDAGKGIIAMKVLSQGDLWETAAQALEFVAQQPWIDAMVIGMVNPSQLQQNLRDVARFRGPT
jgi:aryl-alcohol dehydrogenase-like predicted oxidoreductase